MSVLNPLYVVADKILFGNNSGSCWYGPYGKVLEEKIKWSCNPWVPPPNEMLKGTPICFSFSVLSSLGIISSKFSIIKNK
jgi:hypothetical protein